MTNGMNNVDKFLKYMSKPLTMDALKLVYTSNNIIFERADLYRDFVLSLNDLILETYLGDDVTNLEHQLTHFDWCWKAVSDKLNHGQINFTKNIKVKKYFVNFYFDTFYDVDKDEEYLNISNLSSIWELIFNYNAVKTRADLETFLTLFKLFEESYKKV
jgi:hypothetical protein